MQYKLRATVIRDGNAMDQRRPSAAMTGVAWYPWQSYGARRDQIHSSPVSQTENAQARDLLDWPNELLQESQ